MTRFLLLLCTKYVLHYYQRRCYYFIFMPVWSYKRGFRTRFKNGTIVCFKHFTLQPFKCRLWRMYVAFKSNFRSCFWTSYAFSRIKIDCGALQGFLDTNFGSGFLFIIFIFCTS
uniref:Uncharacterized protein n=1 Tax=Cacopsylla melanoneura TaxID=428564 RepID=A0A8D8ZV36_9HEMI